MKGTPEDIIKGLRCAGALEFCHARFFRCNDCPFKQSVYESDSRRLFADAAELLERCANISDMYQQKCEEVNRLRSRMQAAVQDNFRSHIKNRFERKESGSGISHTLQHAQMRTNTEGGKTWDF